LVRDSSNPNPCFKPIRYSNPNYYGGYTESDNPNLYSNPDSNPNFNIIDFRVRVRLKVVSQSYPIQKNPNPNPNPNHSPTFSGGILAFQILDRVTGQWSVANSPWFADFYQTAIQNIPLLWLIVSLVLWLIVAVIFSTAARRNHYKKQGITTVRVKVNRKVHLDKLQDFLKTKLHTNEERSYEEHNDIVRITYIDN
jgi:hypothetical protein